MLINEVKIFLASITFLTQIPLPLNHEEITKYQRKTPRYYSYVGLVIGAMASILYLAFMQIFSHNSSILFAVAFTIFITGAFHEDGLMDFADGFGGGYTKDDILKIMKDPHAGSYGIILFVMALLIKVSLLFEIKSNMIPFIFIYSHSLSRFFSVSLLPWMDYARSRGKSSFIKGRMTYGQLFFAFLGGLAPVFLFREYYSALIIPILVIPAVIFAMYIKKKIGGYTGDCLGALQQIMEVLIYVLFIFMNRMILF